MAFIATKGLALTYTLGQCRFLTGSANPSARETLSDAVESIRVGFVLMLSTISTMLVIGIARFMVDAYWGLEVFGQFSMAVSLENFVLLFVSQVAMVLFPALRHCTDERIKDLFLLLRNSIASFMPIIYLIYTPLRLVVAWWLPQYAQALDYLAMLLPVCAFDAKMNLVGTTFLKVLRKEKELLAVNVISVVISGIGVLFSTFVLHSVKGVIFSIVVAVVIRSSLAEWRVAKCLGNDSSVISFPEIFFAMLFEATIF